MLVYSAPDQIGPFGLGKPLRSMPTEFEAVPLQPTASDNRARTKPYSVLWSGEEIAILDVRLGLIESVTTFNSFVISGKEMIGEQIEALSLALGEAPNEETEVLHEDGSITIYFDYLDSRIIATTEAKHLASICIY